uniref:RING-CH-type domain-containing protein n=1 Tax=Plectus sambesii TaxID=2011161 RepID=A0A914UMK7_9BILA
MVVTGKNECSAGMVAPSSSASSSTTSNSLRRVCRICQSGSGRLVRPCHCLGTMANVHEQCLYAWIVASRNDQRCEICQRLYAFDGTRLLPVWKWSQPTFTSRTVVEWLLIAALVYVCWYMLTLLDERCTLDRLVVNALPIRSSDVARIAVLTVVVACLGLSLCSQLFKVVDYVARQKMRRYIDAEHHCIEPPSMGKTITV